MTRNVMMLATAAMLSLGVAAEAPAMDQEHSMLTGAVFKEVRRLGLDTDNIDKLTLAEIGVLRDLLSSDQMSETQQKAATRKLLEEAANR